MGFREILLCADDYGQNEAISEGIRRLAASGRINVISCMVNSGHWTHSAASLKQSCNEVYLGLHLNLSFGHALSQTWRHQYGHNFRGLGWLFLQSYMRKLDINRVQAEINAQLDCFIETIGRQPDFIDGHQHCQQFPLVRDAFLAVYRKRKLSSYCRHSHVNWQAAFIAPHFIKQQIITLFGGQYFYKQLQIQQIATHTSFSGSYNFSKAKHYRHYFQQFLRQSTCQGLIMCHPGMVSTDPEDPLFQSRIHEYNYLMSNEFLNDLQMAQCCLKRRQAFP
ncbi:ChbG/HpnK family deacetylase [Legionella genomosp. 1]|uniref:ChbG/HpnK family deacetylase n=1 Tax=Legionella genomosp. 1 TaxID=1093625 RepID=UPI001054C3B2|nr:ChbG/HpnK family deacetylase [Legionella genomosp. 1]